ncbi:hypothetical protein AB7C87_01860 [Natrarchaeobius sp. A-rgal3]|uniref:hypothetical protein n=1 Tax=Natrarchaeobius versutus TaxID=1679078 RepID=UPI00350FCD2A
MVSHLSTETEVEENLNGEFSGDQWEVETFEGETVLVKISTISVRPRVSHSGLPESDYVWGRNFRDNATVTERMRSILFNEWMTEVRFKVINGEPEDLRPQGLNLWYASFLSSSAIALDEREIVTRAVAITDEHEMYSNKLETRIVYDGSPADYTENLEKVMDNIQYMQNNMRKIAKNYLMNIYSPSNEEWDDKERAQDLVSYLYGDEVDLSYVESGVKQLWENPPDKGPDRD